MAEIHTTLDSQWPVPAIDLTLQPLPLGTDIDLSDPLTIAKAQGHKPSKKVAGSHQKEKGKQCAVTLTQHTNPRVRTTNEDININTSQMVRMTIMWWRKRPPNKVGHEAPATILWQMYLLCSTSLTMSYL
jgi:hypothetical protein